MIAKHVSEAIKNRRSVYPKHYSTEKVPDELIWDMLENANWAPTHRFTEPWRFIIFTGEGLQRLAEFQSELYRDLTIADGSYIEAKFEKLRSKPLMCSHIIAICMRRDPEHSVPEMEEVAAVACAVQNMQLTAHANGLGCYWSTGGPTYQEEAKPFFDLGPEDKLMGFLNVGMPSDSPSQGRRRPIQEKVKWVKTAS